jgi:hypothetical protein
MTTETKNPMLADLERRRQALAFDVEQGRDGAEQELEAVEAQIGRILRQEERLALAERERAARAAAEAEAAAGQQRAAAEAHLALKRREQLAAAARVQGQVAPFRAAIEEYLRAGKALYAATQAVGKPPTEKVRGTAQLQQYLHTRLGDVVEIVPPMTGGPRSARMSSLVDLLSGAAYAGPSRPED